PALGGERAPKLGAGKCEQGIEHGEAPASEDCRRRPRGGTAAGGRSATTKERAGHRTLPACRNRVSERAFRANSRARVGTCAPVTQARSDGEPAPEDQRLPPELTRTAARSYEYDAATKRCRG